MFFHGEEKVCFVTAEGYWRDTSGKEWRSVQVTVLLFRESCKFLGAFQSEATVVLLVCIRLSTLNSASPAGLTCAKIRQRIQMSDKSGEEADGHSVQSEA